MIFTRSNLGVTCIFFTLNHFKLPEGGFFFDRKSDLVVLRFLDIVSNFESCKSKIWNGMCICPKVVYSSKWCIQSHEVSLDGTLKFLETIDISFPLKSADKSKKMPMPKKILNRFWKCRKPFENY